MLQYEIASLIMMQLFLWENMFEVMICYYQWCGLYTLESIFRSNKKYHGQ